MEAGLNSSQMAKDKTKYPLRAAVLQAIKVMKESEKLVMSETFDESRRTDHAQLKSAVRRHAKRAGHDDLRNGKGSSPNSRKRAAKRDEEKSKRWLAHYDYRRGTLAGATGVSLRIRLHPRPSPQRQLPPLEPIHYGWRVGSQKKVQINEPKVKDMVKSIGRTWKRIAARESGHALGSSRETREPDGTRLSLAAESGLTLAICPSKLG